MGDSLPEVEYSDRAAKQIEKLETEDGQRILSKLDGVIWKPEHYLKWLQGDEHAPADYRLRVGPWRVLVDWRRDEGVLFVTEVDHRDNIYD